MKITHRFSIEKHSGEYETWPTSSYLLDGGVKTNIKVPGYDLKISFKLDDGRYLLILDYDCSFEELSTAVLLSPKLKIIEKREFPQGELLNVDDCKFESTSSLIIPSFGNSKYRITILQKKFFWKSCIVIDKLV